MLSNAEYQREYRARNREQLRAYDRERYRRSERRAQKARSRARTRSTKRAYDAKRYIDPENKAALISAESRRQRLRFTGFTPEEFAGAIAKQGNACAVCGEPFVVGKTRRAPCADHCHKTGRKRGVLCRGCNLALGIFRDDPSLLRRAAAYLEAP